MSARELVDRAGRIQPACARFPTPGRLVLHETGLWKILRATKFGDNTRAVLRPRRPGTVPWVLGSRTRHPRRGSKPSADSIRRSSCTTRKSICAAVSRPGNADAVHSSGHRRSHRGSEHRAESGPHATRDVPEPCCVLATTWPRPWVVATPPGGDRHCVGVVRTRCRRRVVAPTPLSSRIVGPFVVGDCRRCRAWLAG